LKVICAVSILALAAFASACTDDTLSGPGFICDVTNPVSELRLTPSNASITVRSPANAADILKLTATAINRVGNARTDVPISFTSSDTSVAIVDSAGVLHAKKPGTITVKASTCGQSASSKITILPAVIAIQAVAAATTIVAQDSVLVTARALNQSGVSLAGVKFVFSVSPAGSATITTTSDSTAYIFSKTAGNLTVTATGEGTSGTASIVVLPRSFLSGNVTTASLDAGDSYACGLITLGRGYCWGVNDQNQLGATTDSVCFSDTRAAADTSKTQTVTKPCSLLPRRFAPDSTFTSLAAGVSTACALAAGGRAYCWGTNIHGELGNGGKGGGGAPSLVSSTLSFSMITVGGTQVCALAVGGAAYCWGGDSDGQLGDARRVNSSTPIPVFGGGQAPATFVTISAGLKHTCGLTADGTAFCWGSNDSSQLGVGTPGGAVDIPTQVSTGLHFTSISAGGFHTCAIAVGGAAFCWGDNMSGELGQGTVGGRSSVPVAVVVGQTFTRISAGYLHTCGLTTGGVVFCWGENGDLQLGRGPQTGSSFADGTPAAVGGGELPAGVTFAAVSAGLNHTCGVGSDGAAYCWGSNVFGALGNTLQAAFRGFPQRVATPR
jgi:alpha-tubulin suppressor-like RCC1 family protein